MRRLLSIISILALAVMVDSQAMATNEVDELREDLEALREEVSELKEEVGESESIVKGGYGELHFNDYKNNSKKSAIDFHRFVLFIAHDFNDWITFSSELEVEHALSGEGKPGEVELEQAYIDLLLSRSVNVRTGLMLVPMGIMNETHEPPTFYGVERPDVDKNIIPTTWWEAGVGLFGDLGGGLKYKLYYISGLDAAGFSASSGIRGGRQKVSKATAEDFAIAARLEYTALPGVKLGASYYSGDSGQGDPALADATVTIIEADLQYSISSFDFRGVYATVEVDDADKIKAATGEDVGDTMTGYYVEGAWRFLGLLVPDSDQELALFTRYSEYNTQDGVPAGSTADPANDVEVLTIGFDYKPTPMVSIKVDYQDRDNASAATDAVDQWNAGIGYMF